MSEQYETQQDRIAEDAISSIWINEMKNRRGRTLIHHKMPDGPRYSFDFAYTIPPSDIVCAISEVKDRPGWRKGYGDVMLGASKVKQLVEYSENGLPAYFIVRLPIGVHYCRVTKGVLGFSVRWMGRTDRGSSRDEEPCYMIPLEYFTKCTLAQ